MKNLLPLALLLCVISSLNAQEKFQWGLLVRGGNYALPVKEDPTNYTARIQPGYWVNTGVYARLNLTPGFGFSTELAYGMAEFQKEKYYPYIIVDDYSANFPHHLYTQQSIMAPMKFHFGKSADARFSYFAGGGPFFAWFTEQQIVTEEDGMRYFTGERQLYEEYRHSGRDLRWQWFLNAGFSVRVGEKTRIGLEAFFNPKEQNTDFFYAEAYPVLLRNISLSLYHRAR